MQIDLRPDFKWEQGKLENEDMLSILTVIISEVYYIFCDLL